MSVHDQTPPISLFIPALSACGMARASSDLQFQSPVSMDGCLPSMQQIYAPVVVVARALNRVCTYLHVSLAEWDWAHDMILPPPPESNKV